MLTLSIALMSSAIVSTLIGLTMGIRRVFVPTKNHLLTGAEFVFLAIVLFVAGYLTHLAAESPYYQMPIK